jgi:hypothetical protein
MVELRAALGYNVLGVNAEPYIEYHGVFDVVVARYLNAGATTTSSTTVVAASTPTPVALTLALITGFAAFARVIIDVDTRQEEATVQSVIGSTITVLLTKAHTGTYPVTAEGGETMVRRYLRRIRAIQDQLGDGTVIGAAGAGGLKRVDEIEFWNSSTYGYGSTAIGSLARELTRLRDELAALLGVTNLFRLRMNQGLSISAY